MAKLLATWYRQIVAKLLTGIAAFHGKDTIGVGSKWWHYNGKSWQVHLLEVYHFKSTTHAQIKTVAFEVLISSDQSKLSFLWKLLEWNNNKNMFIFKITIYNIRFTIYITYDNENISFLNYTFTHIIKDKAQFFSNYNSGYIS